MSRRAKAVRFTIALLTFAHFNLALAVVTAVKDRVGVSTAAIVVYLTAMVFVAEGAAVAVDS